jgi:hypothetical protein
MRYGSDEEDSARRTLGLEKWVEWTITRIAFRGGRLDLEAL